MSLHPLSRSVSIIGVGSTKFGNPFDTPELEGLAFQEYGAWATLAAMDDAGVNPREVDHLVMGSVGSPTNNALNISPQHGFLEWVGMKGKSTNYQCAGCASGFNAFNQAVDMVAGGRYDIVVCLDMELNNSITDPDKPSHIRYPFSEYEEVYGFRPNLGVNGVDTGYNRWMGTTFIAQDTTGRHYMREAGITRDDLEDAAIGASVTGREHGALGPDCYAKTPYDQIAREYGFDSVNEYMKSDLNPYFSDMDRVNYCGIKVEGAAALVLCATDIARTYQKKPIEVLNVSQCDLSTMIPDNQRRMTRGALEQIYEVTGVDPSEIEYMASTNMDQYDTIDSAEAAGYMPKGEAWKYFRDGETRFDKEKPMNTDGGAQGLGHAFAASGIHHYAEMVLQMRGEAEGRQIEPAPKVALMRGTGASHSVSCAILRTLEDEPAEEPAAESAAEGSEE